MRLTLALLGLELDITFGPVTDDEQADEGADLSGGTLASYPISFTSSWPTPSEWEPPERTIPWDPEDR